MIKYSHLKAFFHGATVEGFKCGGARMLFNSDSIGPVDFVVNDDLFFADNILFFNFISRIHVHRSKKIITEVVNGRQVGISTFCVSKKELIEAADLLKNWIEKLSSADVQKYMNENKYQLACCMVHGGSFTKKMKEEIVYGDDFELLLGLIPHFTSEDKELWDFVFKIQNSDKLERILYLDIMDELRCPPESLLCLLKNPLTVGGHMLMSKRLEILKNYKGGWTTELILFGQNKNPANPNPIHEVITMQYNSIDKLVAKEELFWAGKEYIIENQKLKNKLPRTVESDLSGAL